MKPESGMIYEAITGIMSEVGAIGKNKTNAQQNFKYRGIDDVMNTLNPLLCKHGVFVVPEILEQTREERTSRNGAALIYSICKIMFSFFAKDGSHVSAITIGEGMDNGDKATNKAMAIAFKYACFQVFCIPTEEMKDPDSESHELKPTTQLISKAQAKRMYKLSNENADLCREILQEFNYDKSDEVLKSDYDAICSEIQSRAVA